MQNFSCKSRSDSGKGLKRFQKLFSFVRMKKKTGRYVHTIDLKTRMAFSDRKKTHQCVIFIRMSSLNRLRKAILTKCHNICFMQDKKNCFRSITNTFSFLEPYMYLHSEREGQKSTVGRKVNKQNNESPIHVSWVTTIKTGSAEVLSR